MNGPGHLRRLLLAACLALACSLLPAVPAAAAAGPKTYVGKVEGTDAYIALAVRGDKVKAFVCDAKDVSRWLDGTLARARRAKVATASPSGSAATGPGTPSCAARPATSSC